MGEGLERHVGRRARPNQEQRRRQMDLDTQVKSRIRQILVEDGLERHVRNRTRKDQEQRRPMGL